MSTPRLNRGSVIALPAVSGQAPKVTAAPGAPVAARSAPIFADKHSMQRWAMDVDRHIHELYALLGSAVLGGGNHITGISLTANTLATVAHHLGRPATHFIPTRMLPTGNWSSSWGPILAQALPSGHTSDKYVAIEANWSGSCDLYVF